MGLFKKKDVDPPKGDILTMPEPPRPGQSNNTLPDLPGFEPEQNKTSIEDVLGYIINELKEIRQGQEAQSKYLADIRSRIIKAAE